MIRTHWVGFIIKAVKQEIRRVVDEQVVRTNFGQSRCMHVFRVLGGVILMSAFSLQRVAAMQFISA